MLLHAGDEFSDFPSFSEGLSLRRPHFADVADQHGKFPFLFGGTFIEASKEGKACGFVRAFPFLFGGTFIEALVCGPSGFGKTTISLPFRRDFH